MFVVKNPYTLSDWNDDECEICAANVAGQQEVRECEWYEPGAGQSCIRKTSTTDGSACDDQIVRKDCPPNGI